MRALAHPVRVALVELLSVVDTLTATQASELLGESPANCAFHLRTLAKYGFVQEAGGGRGRERPWKSAERNITISTKQDDPRAATAAGALSLAWLEHWIERARQVFGSSSFLPGWENATGWSRSGVFLTPEETSDLRGQMRRLLETVRGAQVRPGAAPARRAAGGVDGLRRPRSPSSPGSPRRRPARRPSSGQGKSTSLIRFGSLRDSRYILSIVNKRDTS